jgi:hypothetical protein
MDNGRKDARSIASSQAEAVQIAQTVIAGELGLLEGARNLADLGPVLVPEASADPDFSVLVAVASEVDDLPLGPTRALWDPAVLVEKDREISEYESRVRDVVLEACHSIRRRYAAG